jgi:hypothetical protein
MYTLSATAIGGQCLAAIAVGNGQNTQWTSLRGVFFVKMIWQLLLASPPPYKFVIKLNKFIRNF